MVNNIYVLFKDKSKIKSNLNKAKKLNFKTSDA